MKKHEAEKLVKDTFTQSYNEERFRTFVHNLFQNYESLSKRASSGNYIFHAFKDKIPSFKRLAKFLDPKDNKVDVLAVKLGTRRTLENARTMQRNFIAHYLNGSRGGKKKEAALVAFYSDDCDDWRFSLVRMDYVRDKEKQKVRKKLTPARRHSFLVGKNEKTHTACKQWLPVLQSETETTLAELEAAFNIEIVTKEFFEEYKALYLSLRDAIGKQLEKNGKTKDKFETKTLKAEDFAKRFLGQIVFLYFLQKKGWLGVKKGEKWGTGPKNFLRALYDRKYGEYRNFFSDMLEPLFYEALGAERHDNYYDPLKCRIPFLNGGLFEATHNNDRMNNGILLDDAIFKKIFDVFDLYNFTVREDEPLDKEVAVDPEMLGKVFENLIPENERKGSGTYYTPREIVHYMCQESLINYLDAKLNIEHRPVDEANQKILIPDMIKADSSAKYEDFYAPVVSREDLTKFIYHGDTAQEHEVTAEVKAQREDYKGKYQHIIPESVRKYHKLIDEALASVKICDPAIGSGAFPLGVMNEIVRARRVLNAYLGDDNRTPYDFKRHAIQESIYGVDIEPSAVDIAKLRLWLSLVVDEDDFDAIKPLPNLDYKIVSGNSLIGFPFINTPRLEEKLRKLPPLQDQYFNASSPSKKTELRTKINSLIESEYNNLNTKKSLGYEVDFDFRLSFFEVFDANDGFDIVIANPPYIDSEGMVNSGQGYVRDIVTSTYKTTKGNWDIYIAFFERSLEMLNKNGILTYITPDKWISKPFGDALRKQYIGNIYSILNAGRKIFESAKVDSIVTIIRKIPSATILSYEIDDKKIVYKGCIEKSNLTMPFKLDILFSKYFNLIQKIENRITGKLGDIASCENACATSDAYDLKEVIFDGSKANSFSEFFKVVNTGTLAKYNSKYGLKEMTYLKEKYLYPVVKKYTFIKSFGRSYVNRTKKSKIIIKGLTLLDGFIDFNAEYIPGKSTLVIPCSNKETLMYLAAIVNSKLAFFYIKEKNSASSYNSGINFTKDMLNTLPVPAPEKEPRQFEAILIEVTKVVASGETDAEKQKDYLKRIDRLIYQLYDLTPEEIAIVEEAVQ